MAYIAHLEFRQLACAQFAVDGQVKPGKVAHARRTLQADANGPDFLQLQGCFRPVNRSVPRPP
jgi:hypothetical protein